MAITKLPIEKGVERRADEFRGDKADLRLVRLQPLTADPADAADGDIWYRDDLKKYRVRESGVNKTITAV